MRLRYDDDFVESTVFLAAGRRRPGVPATLLRCYHAARERCYELLDPEERNTAFFNLNLKWFRAWGIELLLLQPLNGFPLLPPALQLLAFRKVKSRKDEGAELYASPEHGRTAVVAMRPERFGEDAPVADFLRHEYLHLHDMVDPAFGYVPSLPTHAVSATQQRIVRERFRLLWDTAVDGRLGCDSCETRHRGCIDRAYSFWPESKRAEIFAELWTGSSPKYERLLELASDPRGLAHAGQPLPGASCPLCGFPTFNWSAPAALSAPIRAAIERRFPNWTADQGACGRCIETYEAAGKFEAPSTVVLDG